MNKESKITDSDDFKVQYEHCELIAQFEKSFIHWEVPIDKELILQILDKNNKIDTPFKLAFAYDLIKTCNVDNAMLPKIHEIIEDIQEDKEFKEIWLSYHNSGEKLDLTKTKEDIKKDWLNLKIEYDGKLNCPNNMKLLTIPHNRINDIWGKPAKAWTKMLNRKMFVIKALDEKLGEMLFPVQMDENDSYFVLGKGFSPMRNQEYINLSRELWEVIINPENQQFFQQNYRHSNDQLRHQHQEVLDLLDEL